MSSACLLEQWIMSSPEDDETMLSLAEEVDECVFTMDYERPPPAIAMHHQNPYHVLEAIVEPSTQVEIEVHERAMKHLREIGEERRTRSLLKRRLMMRLRKDGYDASLCRSSWVATAEHPGGDYEYIDVVVAGEHGGGAASSSSSSSSRIVVDIDFSSQFQLARPAPWYAQLWARLPAVFVGPRARLRKAVSLLCEAAQRSLRESGLHVPPWRRSGYMQAKWLPGGASEAVAAAAAAQRSVAIARGAGGGTRRPGAGAGAGGLSMALLSSSGAEANGCQGQAGSMWA
ncbi:hypothetical protein Zm00014a_000752 [Zea mays]|uniref:DUF506 family protein n=1 Tax=Zea mays TaxID=4577 RepID=A0A3L6FE26_MAIZE|nr:hypothetical protein Zm00014a_000752 [Zea mays]